MSRAARDELLGMVPDADLPPPERDVDLARLNEVPANKQAERGAVHDAEHYAASASAQHEWGCDAQLARERAA
eukprot:2744129-Pyramimonas_sp.AAC.1